MTKVLFFSVHVLETLGGHMTLRQASFMLAPLHATALGPELSVDEWQGWTMNTGFCCDGFGGMLQWAPQMASIRLGRVEKSPIKTIPLQGACLSCLIQAGRALGPWTLR